MKAMKAIKAIYMPYIIKPIYDVDFSTKIIGMTIFRKMAKIVRINS